MVSIGQNAFGHFLRASDLLAHRTIALTQIRFKRGPGNRKDQPNLVNRPKERLPLSYQILEFLSFQPLSEYIF